MMLDYTKITQEQYIRLVDDILLEEVGVTSLDVGTQHMKSCQECGQSPTECADEIKCKYNTWMVMYND